MFLPDRFSREQHRYPEMSRALMKVGRPIYFSLCEWYSS